MNSSISGMLCILLAALCFSTTGFTQALVLDSGATPLTVGAIRMLVSGTALFLWVLAHRGIKPFRSWHYPSLAMCCFGIAGYQLFFFTGTYHVGVAVASVVSMGTTPVFAAIIAALLFREFPSRAWYPSTAVALAGILLMNSSVPSGVPAAALLFPLGAGACYAVHLNASRRLIKDKPPEVVMAAVLLSCGIMLSPLFFFEPVGWLGTAAGLIAAAHLGIITSALAFVLLLKGLRTTPPATAATLGLAEPAASCVLGFCCLGEPMTMEALLGAVMIIGGALMLIFLPRLSLFRSR